MTNHSTPIYAAPRARTDAGPTSPRRPKPVIEQDARTRRSARAFDGWLTTLIRTRVANRRRANSEPLSNRPVT